LPFIEGQFNVVAVPAALGDISIKFSQQNILPIIFPLGELVELTVYDELLKRLQTKADSKGIELKGTEISMRVPIHAEATLLAYHLQHPQIKPYGYFGGSKLSCHGCATLFSSFNLVAESFHFPQHFTKCCHKKIYLQWPCPLLLSQEQQMGLQLGTPSLDTQVRNEMMVALSTKLSTYVHELCAVAEGPSQLQLNSAAASGDSGHSVVEARAKM
jgi:OTT_1508-like deaminase